MKLKEAIELAKDCGLSTYGEAVANVYTHATMIFPYGKIAEEEKELHAEIDTLAKSKNIKAEELFKKNFNDNL